MFDALQQKGFTVLTLHHAEAILTHDLPETVDELTGALDDISIPVEELVRGGGGETKFTQRLRKTLTDQGWNKHNFVIKETIDGNPTQSLSHEVDHVRRVEKGVVALELEWNNKDPFFDRDLENFSRLHGKGAISVGMIITRGRSLHDSLEDKMEAFARKARITGPKALKKYYTPTPRQIGLMKRRAEIVGSFEKAWASIFVSDKFGEATTHWRKLTERVDRGVGNPCPLVLVGLPDTIVKP